MVLRLPSLNRAHLLTTALLIAGLGLAVYLLLFRPDQLSAPGNVSTGPSESEQPAPEETAPLPPFIDLQPVVEAWAARQRGNAGVVVIDLDNQRTAATWRPDATYFAASIYKLYVAYAGYQKVEAGAYSLEQPYINGLAVGQCLDEMIRTSNSPCAEKMRTDIGAASLTEQMHSYGMAETSLTNIVTSAGDGAIILQRLYERDDLTDAHTDRLLNSMKNQIHRNALQAGFKSSVVYDKVGFRDYDEYHDVALVEIGERNYVVSVLTTKVGTRNIAGLATAIEQAVLAGTNRTEGQ